MTDEVEPRPCPRFNRASDFAPQNPRDKIGVTIAVTPILYSFEPVIAASKQLPYEVLLDAGFLFSGRNHLKSLLGAKALFQTGGIIGVGFRLISAEMWL